MVVSSLRFIACVAFSIASGTSALSVVAPKKSYLDSLATSLPSTSSPTKAPSGYLDSLGSSSSSSSSSANKTTTNVATPVTKDAPVLTLTVRKKEVTGIVGPGKRVFLLLIFLLLTTLAQFFLPLPKQFVDQLGQYWAAPETVEQVSRPSPVNMPPQADKEVQDMDEWAF
jgi:hypothetical protein